MEQNRGHDNQHVFDRQSQKYRLGLWRESFAKYTEACSQYSSLENDLELMLNPPDFMDCRI